MQCLLFLHLLRYLKFIFWQHEIYEHRFMFMNALDRGEGAALRGRGKRRNPRPGYFDTKAWSRPYMREYMRKVRARQKLERDRNEAVNAAMARLSNRAPTTDLSVSDRLSRSEAIIADLQLVLEAVKRRVVEACEKGPKPA
jgi:hypothetical protein